MEAWPLFVDWIVNIPSILYTAGWLYLETGSSKRPGGSMPR